MYKQKVEEWIKKKFDELNRENIVHFYKSIFTNRKYKYIMRKIDIKVIPLGKEDENEKNNTNFYGSFNNNGCNCSKIQKGW